MCVELGVVCCVVTWLAFGVGGCFAFCGLWCRLGVVGAGLYIVSVCRLLVLRYFCLVPFLVLVVGCELVCRISVYYWRLCCDLVGLVYLWCFAVCICFVVY